MVETWIHGIDMDSWYRHGLMVQIWTHGIDNTNGIDLCVVLRIRCQLCRYSEAKQAKQSLATLKPRLASFLAKYSSSTIDPVELIRKYQRSKKTTTSPPAADGNYPTKFHYPEKAAATGAIAARPEGYARYTTSASFRKPHGDKSQSSGKESFTSKTFGSKAAVERAGQGQGQGQEWKEVEARRMQEVKKQAGSWQRKRQEEVRRRQEEVRRKKEKRQQVKHEERRMEEKIYRDFEEKRKEEEERMEEEKRREEEKTREEEKRWEEENKRVGKRRMEDDARTFHTTLVPVKLHKVAVAPTDIIFLDGYYKKPTAPRKMDTLQYGEPASSPGLGFTQSLDYVEEELPSRGAKGPSYPGGSQSGLGSQSGMGSLASLWFPHLLPKKSQDAGSLEEPRSPAQQLLTTARPILTTLRSLLLHPFRQGQGERRQEEEQGTRQDFPYMFQRPVAGGRREGGGGGAGAGAGELVGRREGGGGEGSPTLGELEAGRQVDRQLLNPG